MRLTLYVRSYISSIGSVFDHCRSIQTLPEVSSLIINHNSIKPRTVEEPRQAWIERLDTNLGSRYVGLINLHPDIFASYPRLDIIQENVVWQQKYKFVNMENAYTRAECRGGGRKPWPQKGTGRARHGSIRAPQWRKGGVAHGPRRFTTQFYMLPFSKRVHGLASTLSAKFAQDDLKIVESLDIQSDGYQFIEAFCDDRVWGPSVLFVDDTDVMPKNITLATETIGHYNIMPVYGLNVYSMLKHTTVVLTVAAVQKIEEKLLFHMNRIDKFHKEQKFIM